MLHLTKDEVTLEIKPALYCAISKQRIVDATYANVIWVFKTTKDHYYDGEIVGDPIIVSKERSAKAIVDKHLGIEDDPSLRTQWMQLDEYLTTLCDSLGGLGREPDMPKEMYAVAELNTDGVQLQTHE
jgi:hypothetical protein